MKLAVFQMSAAIDPEARPARIIAAMEEAAREGALLMVAPELALSGYGRGAEMPGVAQHADGAWANLLSEAAQRIGISVIAGFPERAGDMRYISALVVDHTQPDARKVYRKGSLYGDYEKGLFRPNGPSTLLVEMHGLKVGLLICYDIEFPENTRRLALAGADLVAVPTALPLGPSARFIAEQMIQVRAFENQVFVAYADNADREGAFVYQGQSVIAAPDGAALAVAQVTGDALIYAEIDPAAYQTGRQENPYLADVKAAGIAVG